MSGIFISYSTQNSALALSVVEALESRDIACRIGERDIPPGFPWDETIPEWLDEAPVMVFLLSEASSNSTDCRNEIRLAGDRDVPIVTVCLDDTVLQPALQYHLGGRQFLRVTPNSDAWIEPIVRSVERVLATQPKNAALDG